MAGIRLTIEAFFDFENAARLNGITEAVQEALDSLRGEGAARIRSGGYDKDGTMDKFMDEGAGLTAITFETTQPVMVSLEVD